MKRRQFIATLGAGAAATAIAAPAIAQSSPELKWRLASSFPKSLDTLWGGAETFCKAVAEATDNKFQIQPFAAGEIVPPFAVADAVGNNTIEMAQTASYYFFGKDPTFALACAFPFGLNTRMQNAWMYQHGGMDMLNDFYKKFNFVAFPAGNTTCQMGGWFRKEIKDVADLNGLKFRIAGLAGRVLQKLGVVPTQLPGSDIYAALERGTIDAAEWVGPYRRREDGFRESGAVLLLPRLVGRRHRDPQLRQYREVELAAQELPGDRQIGIRHRQHHDDGEIRCGKSGRAEEAVGQNAQLRPFSQAIMDACYKAAGEVYAEISATNPEFKKVYDNISAFRADQYLWWRVAEYSYDSYMVRARSRT